jgi:hypothetical protein
MLACMSLRPRYSLLTLLVLTALVAGAVKWWRGPHHVVERVSHLELEYTYSNDCLGNQVYHGPTFIRCFDAEGGLEEVIVGYSRHGQDIPFSWSLSRVLRIGPPLEKMTHTDAFGQLPLSPEEQLELQQAIAAERIKMKKTNTDEWKYREALSLLKEQK